MKIEIDSELLRAAARVLEAGISEHANELARELRSKVADAELERELRLDEERIADEMEWEAVRGISAPDY